MNGPTNLTSGIELPDGRWINVSITIPDGHPIAADPSELADTAEIAQMGAARVLQILTRSDQSRARRARRAARDEVPF